MKVAISAETAIDLSKDLLERFDIKTTPFTILLGEKSVLDGDIEISEIFQYVSNTKVLPKTSAVNEYQFTEHFTNLLKEYDSVIHFSMSSTMSSAYNNAVMASKNFENVYVVDTKSLCTGIALLAIKARKMLEAGKSIDDVLSKIEEYKPKLQVSLIVNKLDYLRKGGRCSALVCFGANLLQIRPQLLLKNGKLHPAKKYRGNFDKCVISYAKDTLSEFNNYDKDIAFLTYTSASEQVKKEITDLLYKAGFKEVLETTAGCTIASHAGPNALGVIYLTK